MKTIQERAKEWSKHYCTKSRRDIVEIAYIQGASVQLKTDTDLICDLMITMLNDGMIETRDIGAVNTRIRQAMEEQP